MSKKSTERVSQRQRVSFYLNMLIIAAFALYYQLYGWPQTAWGYFGAAILLFMTSFVVADLRNYFGKINVKNSK